MAEELRLAFGNTAEDYDCGRPGWPDAAAEAGGLPPSAEVLDLGAEAAVRHYLRPDVQAGGAIYDSGAWRESLGDSAFEPLREGVLEHEERLDRDDMLSLALSQSIIAVLPEDERLALAAKLRGLIPDVTFTLPVCDEIHWTRLR